MFWGGKNWELRVPLSNCLARTPLNILNNSPAQNQSFSYPTRTRFLLEARINRLEEIGFTNMGFVGETYFCKLAWHSGY